MEIIIPDINLGAITPQLILVIAACVVLLLGVFLESSRRLIAYIAFFSCLAAIFSIFSLWDVDRKVFSGMLTINSYSHSFSLIILISAALICLTTSESVVLDKCGEFYCILLLSTFGMIVMASSQHLIIIFLGLEILSIGLYSLIGINRSRIRSLEAAIKYFLLGAFASGFFLFGISITYGVTGSFDLTEVAAFLQRINLLGHPLMLAGISLLFIGFGFKVALIPFHMWSPDVYQGSPAPITAFIATAPKAAAFAAFARVFVEGLSTLYIDWADMMFWVCIITIVAGNLLALIQRDIKRMLAYSSIAHAGYILMALLAGPLLGDSELAISSIKFYIMAYALMNILAFSVVHIFESREGTNLAIEDFAGFGKKYPMLSIAMTIAMLSLAGIPLTGGFIGKLQIFSAAISAGYVGLTIVAVIAAVVSVYYYLNVLVKMYFSEPDQELGDITVSRSTGLAIVLSSLGVILMGVVPSIVMRIF